MSKERDRLDRLCKKHPALGRVMHTSAPTRALIERGIIAGDEDETILAAAVVFLANHTEVLLAEVLRLQLEAPPPAITVDGKTYVFRPEGT